MYIIKKSVIILGVLLILCAIYLNNIIPLVLGWGYSSNYENVSVRTQVNVTESYPEIKNITCNNNQDISLNPGTTKLVNCTIEIQDYNGWNDINYVNGTFYYYLNESSDPDDNNTHYTNTSCNYTSNDGQYLANWTCYFDVLYYANNGTWEMNATVNDSNNFSDNDYRNVTISTLIALNVTDVIDFGNMAVGDIKDPAVEANVTNFGNVDINVSVIGWGGNDSVAGAGFAMLCAFRNISIQDERYDINSATTYASMTQITGSSVTIPNFKVAQQTAEDLKSINATYWRLYVNESTNPFGICNGTVVFEALTP